MEFLKFTTLNLNQINFFAKFCIIDLCIIIYVCIINALMQQSYYKEHYYHISGTIDQVDSSFVRICGFLKKKVLIFA